LKKLRNFSGVPSSKTEPMQKPFCKKSKERFPTLHKLSKANTFVAVNFLTFENSRCQIIILCISPL